MIGLLKPGERIDDLQYKGLRIIQNPKGFCFGIDAVLLTGFARIRKGWKAADLGCGTGIISILLAGKTEASHITGIEIQPEAADMADRSVRLNGVQNRVRIINADLKEAPSVLGVFSMDAVVTNPPYRTKGCGIVNPDDAKAVARHEILCSLGDIVEASRALLKPGGSLFMVHRPDRLVDIISGLRSCGIEPKRMRFVHPHKDKPPMLVLIEALKGGKPYMKVEKPLIIYEESKYTEEVMQIYYGG